MRFGVILLAFLLTQCQPEIAPKTTISSPDGNISISFDLQPSGAPQYGVRYHQKDLILPSTLGLEFRDHPALHDGMTVIGTSEREINETWEMPWGEQHLVENHGNELKVELKEKNEPGRMLNLYFRAYNDGIAFRYEIPKQEGMDTLIIMDENSQFRLNEDPLTWWIPGDWDIYEHLYNETKLSKINAIAKRNHPNLAQTYIPENAVNTPFTMRLSDGTHLVFHEADLTNYAGMTLKVDTTSDELMSELVGSDRFGWKAKVATPFHTPWRTIQISPNAEGLITSRLIENLCEPNKIGDVSWFKPMKYDGIWWEMHLGISTWDYAGTQDMNSFDQIGNMKPTGKHGATTANAKRYIDFAAANNLKGVLVEGWNVGWEHWIGFEDREGVFDFVTPYPDYDLPEVVRYAKSKGVEIIMHHETSAAPRTYDHQLDTAYQLMQSLGLHSVKTGYVGKIIPKGEYHHGQWMVNHYRKVIETAAKYQIAVDAHEPIKGTGLRRTYPNIISREGLRGQEWNAWSTDGGNPPQHLSIIAFTRMLAGPIDFTPGVFNIKLDPYKPNNQVNTTLAQQLALYVVIYSPIQMACDLPENYEGQPGFQFIRDVGVDWEQTRVIKGDVGDYVIIAREERATGNWFVGGITDENFRDALFDLDFLPPNTTFTATLYHDGPDADWDKNPLALEIDKKEVTSEDVYTVYMAPGGGFALSLIKQ